MKKKLYIIGGVILLVLAGLVLWCFGFNFDTREDSVNFKKEFEYYNRRKSEDGTVYKNIKIPRDNDIYYFDELNNIDHFVFIGSPKSNESRAIINTLITTLKESKFDKITYFNIEENDFNILKNAFGLGEEQPIVLSVNDGCVVGMIKDTNNFKDNLKSLIAQTEGSLKPNVCDETC